MSRTHLVWDWNGTLLDDLPLVVAATNLALTAAGGHSIDAEEHRRRYRRPVPEFYGEVLGRVIDQQEFGVLDAIFHDAYRDGLTSMTLAPDATLALRSWAGPQSLLSMWFHDELLPAIERHGLTDTFVGVDGLRLAVGGALKAEHLARHLTRMEVSGAQAVLIGDSLDDAHAAESVGAGIVLYTGGFTDPSRLRMSGLPVADSLVEAVNLARRV